MRVTRLAYRSDSAALFGLIAAEPWAVFLDSGRLDNRAVAPAGLVSARFDILAARPFMTLVTRGEVTEISRNGVLRHSVEDVFSLLRDCLAAEAVPTQLPDLLSLPDLPFMGGAIGYFGYDLARRIEPLASTKPVDVDAVPDLVVGIYDWAVVVDHEQCESWLVAAERDPNSAVIWPDLVAMFSHALDCDVVRDGAQPLASSFQVGDVVCNFSLATYRAAFEQIQRYIHAGDCYQVNLAQRFSAPVSGDHWLGYQALRRLNPAPHSAYLNFPGVRVLSSSPERFLSVRQGVVETKPIKGTRPRAAEAAADAALALALSLSEKDRAENLMIVDLLRNDLGKVCLPGSVQVPRLFEVAHFATVHHLVSTVIGRLAPGCDALGLLRAAFPGGSITGAPKLRAMQIIDELEPHRRGVYCGAIGWLGFNGDMDTSIAIRTVVSANGQLEFCAGGGIVADSEADAEYRECFDKAAALLNWVAQFGGSQIGIR
jgi:para-aminobenzoate synthetase component I